MKRLLLVPFIPFMLLVLFSCNSGKENAYRKVEVVNPIVVHDTVYMESRVIEKKIDLTNMPSYCDPKRFTITHVGDRYYVTLPRGTYDDYFTNVKDAQANINTRAKESYDRWVSSGGISY